ncbi:MAG: flagellar brake protein [Gammaproteobacteria bacterium]|nr:flagellar brake protein [Gammaproteobacteria bacterium]
MKNILPRRRQTIAGDDEFRVIAKEQVVALLLRASATHLLFRVELPGQAHSFSTALLGIYDEHDFLILDELSPEFGDRLLRVGQRITLTGRLEGVVLSFSTQLLEIRKKNGAAFYKARLPATLHYQQQRSANRVTSSGADIDFHALRGRGSSQLLKGYVSDLSREGVGIILTDEVELYPGEIISSCLLRLPGEGEISFSLEVCFCKTDRQQQFTRLGGRFEVIDPSSLQKILRVLKRMQHEQATGVNPTAI